MHCLLRPPLCSLHLSFVRTVYGLFTLCLCRTLVAPSPYAFAIWGPIYLLEAYAMIYIATLSPSSPLVSILQRTAPFWFLANVFQALWSCSFRKKFVTGSPLAKILSPLFLSLTSLSLSKIHAIATQSRATITRFEYATAFFGIALHFGWTAAASLVNINGSLAYALASLSLQKYAGFLSVLAATALALFVVAGGGGGIVPLVLAWALKAVGSGMTARLKIEKGNQVGAGAMKTLSEAGAGVCAALGVWGLTGGDGAGDFWGGKWGSGDLIF